MNTDDKKYNKGVLKMGVLAKPVDVTFTLKADKAEEFRNIDGSKKIKEIQKQSKEIKNIIMDDSLYGKK